MIQNNEGLNTSRMSANNGQEFFEGTAEHEGVWFGFMPHKDGCKLTSITVADKDGNEIDENDLPLSTIVGTTLDLDSFIGAGVVPGDNGAQKGYITKIKFASGGGTCYRDTLAK